MNSLCSQQDGNVVRTSSFLRSAARIIAAGLVTAIAACAGVEPRTTSEARVKERAQLRWNALVQGDVKTSYDYFSPGSKTGFSLADYGTSVRIGFWKAVTVESVECSTPDRCEALATIEYVHRGMQIKSPHRETWIRDGSDWWLLRR